MGAGLPVQAEAVWFTRPRHAEILPAAVRPCGDDEITVQAIASGISHGTEMLIYRGEAPESQGLTPETCEGASMGSFPIKYGYQSVGRVISAGSHAGLEVGDLVFVRFPHQTMYTVRTSPDLVYRMPQYEHPEIAIFGNLLDVAVNAVLDVPVRVGDVVAVFGLGVVGLFCAQLARRTAAKLIVVDPVRQRRELALRFGADVAVVPGDALAAIADASEGRLADITIEASGAPAALQTAIDVTGAEGSVVVVSWYGKKTVPLALAPAFHMRRQKLVSSQVNTIGSGLQPRWTVARRMGLVLNILPSMHPLEMISHRFAFADAPDAYRLIDEHPEEVTAVALTY